MKTFRSFPTLNHRSSRSSALKRRFAVAVTLGAAIASPAGVVASTASAADCDRAFFTCDGYASAGTSREHGPIYKTLDAVAGGIEKVFGLDKRHHRGCDAGSCDNGCDAAAMHELMTPRPHGSTHGSHPMHGSHPTRGWGGLHAPPATQAPEILQVPDSMPMLKPQDSDQRPPQRDSSSMAQPKTQVSPSVPKLHMTEPRISDSPAGEDRREAMPIPPRRQAVPERSAPPQSIPTPKPDSADDSIFDSLSNPFDDDTVYVAPLPPHIEQHPVRAVTYQESSKRSGNEPR